MVILTMCVEKLRSWSELKKLTGLSHTKISVHLKELATEGYLRKMKNGLYGVTEKGLKVVEKFSRQRYAEEAQPQLAPLDVEEFILPKLKDLEKEALSKIHEPWERLEQEFMQIIIGNLHTAIAEKTELAHLSSHLVKGLDLSVFPTPAPEERQDIVKASLRLLSELMKIQPFRDKVAEHGRMTILLTLDLGDSRLPVSFKSSALHHIFA